MTARGLRNFNPGNIRHSATVWQGQAYDQSGDPDFVIFKSAQYGIRAMARNLMNYQARDGCKTIGQIIARYAPQNENNTPAYVSAVLTSLKGAGIVNDAGIPYGADEPISVDSSAIMLALIKAIILHEDGSVPYSDSLISEGLHMAGIADAKPKPLHLQAQFQAKVGAVVSGAGAVAANGAQYAPTVKSWADRLADYSGSPIIQHVVTVLLTVAGGLAILSFVSDVLKQKAS